MGSLKEVVNGLISKWEPVTGGIPQVSVLGLVHCSIFAGTMDGGIRCTLISFTSDTQQCSAVTTLLEGMPSRGLLAGWREGFVQTS